MSFQIHQVPEEVQNVWNIQMAGEIAKTGVGVKIWEDCQRIINKYPEWFPADPKEELPVSEQRLKEIQNQNS